MATDWYDAPNQRYIDEATGLVDPNPSGQTIAGARPDANLSGLSYIPGTSASSDPAAIQQQYGVAPTRDAAGLYQLPDSVLNRYGGFDGSLAAFAAPLIIGTAGTAAALGGFGGAAGLGATGLAEGGALAGEAGFLPGSFELGASGYGGTAAAGLDAAGAEFLGAGGLAGAAGGGSPAGTQFIPAINSLQALENSSLFGIPDAGVNLGAGSSGLTQGAALAGEQGFLPGSFDIGASNLGAGGPGFAGATDLAGNVATSTADEVLKKIKEGGGTAMDWITKNPASAAMLGLSAANALSKPKLPEAAQAVQKANTPNLAAASGVINSGGSTGPAWNTQKAAIDSAIDRQIAEKRQQILQQAQNSGMGVDSLVTVQQIQKMQEQMEGLRQQQYMQAQQQNVQAALSEMGMSNQALGQVAGQQFASSKEAQTSAAQTAQLALMLQQMQKPTANQQAAPANA